MSKLSAWKMTCAIFALCAATALAAHAQVFTSLVNFDGANGANPSYTSLIQGTDGSFYGTTSSGGDTGSFGTVFKTTSEGILVTLYSFCSQTNCIDGIRPLAGLIQASDGNLYGTTYSGGVSGLGTVFKMTLGGKLTTLHSFNSSDGAQPVGALVQAPDGNFYGTTSSGGRSNHCKAGCGTIFRITPQGTLTTLHSFDGIHGAQPLAALVQTSDGSFYGTTYAGGDTKACRNGCGTIFRISSAGTTTMHVFEGPDGTNPLGGLAQASDGDLYGTAYNGGNFACSAPYGCGTAFKITIGGMLTTLHIFDLADGSQPFAAPLQGSDGGFYGTTQGGGANGSCYGGCGTIFAITSAGTLTTLYSFCSQLGCPDGFDVEGGLFQGTAGTFYGTTFRGGASDDGTLFSLSMGLGPFVSFVRATGKVGQTGGILGQGFTGTTSVVLNETPATFTVVSDTFIKATVPAGATTGYVTVTTPSGSLNSNKPFVVIP